MSALSTTLSTRLLPAALATAALLCSASAAHAGVPDIEVYDVDGPATAQAGNNVVVDLKCRNHGTYWAGRLYVGIYLSADSTITEEDLRVDYDDYNWSQSQPNPKAIFRLPNNVPSGTYYWGAIAKKLAGEVHLANNAKAGNQVVVDGVNPPASDLCLDDDDDITVVYTLGTSQPAPIQRTIMNCGDAGSTLSWSLSGNEPAWISTSLSSGNVLQGAQQAISIQLHPSGLIPGLYQTTLIFSNSQNVADTEHVDIHFLVGDVDFRPGDKVSGTTTAGEPYHARTFMGQAGMKLKLSMKKLDKKLKMRVTVLDDQGNQVHSKLLKKKGKKKKTSMTLPEDGLYTLICETVGGTGKYQIKTKSAY